LDIFYFAFFLVFYLCFAPQEKKLMEEIKRLNDEIHGCDENTKSRRTNITTKESQIAQSRKGFNRYKEKRDKLHDKRKSVYLFFFW
jgi:predicted  nucleic acid-binding Zn-ribbon protein